MDSEKINQLIKLLNEHGLTEIEFSEGNESIRIKRDSAPVPQRTFVQPSSSNAISPPTTTMTEGATSPNLLKAPVVGTVYLAPAPGAEPFVNVGQTVKKGDILCIIEAMKMMNHIEAHKDGVIKKRLVTDKMSVQYDDPLFVIE